MYAPSSIETVVSVWGIKEMEIFLQEFIFPFIACSLFYMLSVSSKSHSDFHFITAKTASVPTAQTKRIF